MRVFSNKFNTAFYQLWPSPYIFPIHNARSYPLQSLRPYVTGSDRYGELLFQVSYKCRRDTNLLDRTHPFCFSRRDSNHTFAFDLTGFAMYQEYIGHSGETLNLQALQLLTSRHYCDLRLAGLKVANLSELLSRLATM